MKAVIMAGGLGSRLRPLTIGCPKPMVSFVNKPVLDHTLDLLKRHHIFDVVITVQYLADQIQNYLGDGSRHGMTIRYAVEEIPLGTAGSVKNAQPYLDQGTFLVISGDAITDINLSRVIRFHREKRALATLALQQVSNPHQYGVVVTDNSGCVKHYVEKPGPEQTCSNTVNTGIYVLEPEVLALMEPNQAYDFSLDIFPLLLNQNGLFGCPADGYWCDMGTIQSYLKATADALAGKVSHIMPESIGDRHENDDDHYVHHKIEEHDMVNLLRNRKLYPLFWIILALAVLAADYVMGPFIQFPFLFIIPVMLASWYNGRRWGFLFAIGLPFVRLLFSMLWIVPWTMLDSMVNALIRISVLLLLAYLVDRTAVQTQALTQEIQILRGILPICSFCKKIRNEDSTWEQLERYITRHSEAIFSHGLCPACAKEHYAEFLTE